MVDVGVVHVPAALVVVGGGCQTLRGAGVTVVTAAGGGSGVAVVVASCLPLEGVDVDVGPQELELRVGEMAGDAACSDVC